MDKFSYFHSTGLDARLANVSFISKGKRKSWFRLIGLINAKREIWFRITIKIRKKRRSHNVHVFYRLIHIEVPFYYFPRFEGSENRFISNRLLIPIRLLEIVIWIVMHRLWNIYLNLNLFKCTRKEAEILNILELMFHVKFHVWTRYVSQSYVSP